MPAYNNIIAEYFNTTTVSYELIPDIISFSCRTGRQEASQQWAPMTGIIRARYDGSYNVEDIVIKRGIRWYTTFNRWNNGFPNGECFLKNVRVIWGKPYNSGTGVGNDDEIEFEFEGGLGVLGRTRDDLPLGYTYVSDVVDTDVPDTPESEIVGPTGLLNNQTTYQRIADSVQGRICDGLTSPYVFLSRSSNTPYSTVSFSDTTNNATHIAYDDIQFSGLADDSFNIITVQPESLPPVTVNLGSPEYYLDVLTWNKYTSTAEGLAQYLGVKFAQDSPSPSKITAKTSAQSSLNNYPNLFDLGRDQDLFGNLVKFRVKIDFRGQTYYAQIEGVEMDVNLSEGRVTYYLSPDDGLGWFTLDSATLGVLDEDKLGFN